MPDLSYAQALEAAAEPHRVILGPAPCHTCGAWVEWAGAEWLALGTTERHECAPFLEGQAWRANDMAMLERQSGHALELVGAWTRGEAEPYLMAYPAPQPLPAWVRTLGAGILWVAFFFAVAFAIALMARAGGW